MKRIMLITISLVIYFFSEAQDSCVIKLNLTDCNTCYGGLSNISNNFKCHYSIEYNKLNILQKSKDSTKIILVVKKNDSNSVKKFIENYLDLHFTYDLISSDSLYQAINTDLTSEILLYSKNSLIFKSLLKSFDNRLSLNLKKKYSIYLNDSSLNISNCIVLVKNDFLIIQDFTFNEVSIYDLKTGIIKNKICFNNLNPETFFKLESVDTTSINIYKKSISTLKQYGITKIQCLGVDYNNNNLYFNLSVRIPKFDTISKSSTLLNRYILLVQSLTNDSIKYYCVNDFEKKTLNKNSLFINSGPYFCSNNDFMFVCSSLNSNDSIYFVIFNLLNTNLVLKKIVNIPYLAFYKQPELRNFVVISGKINFPYFISYKSNEIVNIISNNIIKLPYNFDIVSSKSDFLDQNRFTFNLLDIHQNNDILEILHSFKENGKYKYYLSLLSIRLNRVIFCSQLLYDEDPSLKIVAFSSDGSLLGITNSNHIILLKIPENTNNF